MPDLFESRLAAILERTREAMGIAVKEAQQEATAVGAWGGSGMGISMAQKVEVAARAGVADIASAYHASRQWAPWLWATRRAEAVAKFKGLVLEAEQFYRPSSAFPSDSASSIFRSGLAEVAERVSLDLEHDLNGASGKHSSRFFDTPIGKLVSHLLAFGAGAALTVLTGGGT